MDPTLRTIFWHLPRFMREDDRRRLYESLGLSEDAQRQLIGVDPVFDDIVERNHPELLEGRQRASYTAEAVVDHPEMVKPALEPRELGILMTVRSQGSRVKYGVGYFRIKGSADPAFLCLRVVKADNPPVYYRLGDPGSDDPMAFAREFNQELLEAVAPPAAEEWGPVSAAVLDEIETLKREYQELDLLGFMWQSAPDVRKSFPQKLVPGPWQAERRVLMAQRIRDFHLAAETTKALTRVILDLADPEMPFPSELFYCKWAAEKPLEPGETFVQRLGNLVRRPIVVTNTVAAEKLLGDLHLAMRATP
jgi:hypothetical protein